MIPTASIIKDSKKPFSAPINQTHVFAIMKRKDLDKKALAMEYSPCPYNFKLLSQILKVAKLMEEFNSDFEILIPTNKMAPFLMASKKTDNVYALAPIAHPYLEVGHK